jgi:hypothetical protein
MNEGRVSWGGNGDWPGNAGDLVAGSFLGASADPANFRVP